METIAQTSTQTPPYRICARCVLDSTVPGIEFSEDGVCNHCRMYEELERRFALDDNAKRKFDNLLAKIRASGRGKKYDCVIGISGGTDSTYCAYMAKRLGLRPLLVHFDNGWVSDLARQNMQKAAKTLGLDLRIVPSDWEQLRRYYVACLKASVPDMCLACLVGISSSLFRVAAEEGIRYIILGTSFRTEGMTPARWGYMDGRYFDDVMRRFGAAGPELRRFNQAHLSDLLRFMFWHRIRTVQLPLYIPYRDKNVRQTLERELGWQYGGRHHFDCRYKPFLAYVHDRKFGIDYRKISKSALVRGGELSRDEALRELQKNPWADASAEIEYVRQRLGLTEADLEALLRTPGKSFLDYRSYHRLFQGFAPLVKLMGRLHLVPETFYERYFRLY